MLPPRTRGSTLPPGPISINGWAAAAIGYRTVAGEPGRTRRGGARRRQEGPTDYQLYVDRAQRASALVDRGDRDGAIAALRELVASDISDLDKSLMCLNLALVHGGAGEVDEALAWYAAGVDFERRHSRYHVAEQRAAFLASLGRDRESEAAYRELLGQPALQEHEKLRIRHNLDLLRKRSG